jgi:hypothetical protein
MKMKWFFALNEKSGDFENYSKMLKVAVYTAQKFTSLKPHFLYDGGENSLTKWLRERNVEIINCRTFLFDELKKIAAKRQDENYLGIGAGAFLRTEIPKVTKDLGFTDNYVLYTDLDVMFLREVTDELEKMSPRYFAVAPEFNTKDYKLMNSGVMLMNLENLRKNDEVFRDFMQREIESLVDKSWDQGAYIEFYRGKYWGFKWDKLPAEFNWKTYWKDFSKAGIIHFHGPKPTQKDVLLSGNPPEHLKPLLPLVGENYGELCDMWEKFSAEIEAAERAN